MIRLSRARLAKLITALAVMITALTLASSSAQAASVSGAFSNIKVTSVSGGSILPWEQIKVTADWSVPDATPAGTTFSLSWPVAQLAGVGGTLALKNAAGSTVATCTLGTASLDCTLSSYVTTHPLNIKGTVWFTLTQVDIPENSTVTIPFKAGDTTISVPYTTSGSVPNSFSGIDFYKDVYVFDGKTTWYIYLPGGVNGQTKDYTNVVIEDTLGSNQTFQQGTLTLEHATKLNSAGTWPLWETASPTLYSLSNVTSKSFVFTAPVLKAGGWWRIVYNVSVTKGYQGQVSNTAKATWDEQSQLTASHSEVYVQAGGTGDAEVKAVSVGDYVWFDANRDGIQDDGSGHGIAGAVLTLTGPDGKSVKDVFGNTVQPITTGSTGVYLFENLPVLSAGQHYTVSVTPPAGYLPTIAGAGTDRALDSSTGSATSGDLTANGDQDLTLDFGFVKGAVSVGDLVWLDTNRNGLQDAGEPGIPNATVTLTGPDNKPVTDNSGATVAPQQTKADGTYLFSDLPILPAGQHYTVTVTTPAGLVATTPNVGTDRAVDSSTGSATSTDLTTDGAKDLTLDFGFVQGAVSVGDLVWNDLNRNGLQDPGEPGIPGVTLTLTGPDGGPVTDLAGSVVGPTTTDTSGAYLFSNLPTLPAGQHYTVTVTPPAQYVPTLADQGSNRADDSSTGSVSSGDLVNNGESDLTLDFGFQEQINLTLTKTLDTPSPVRNGAVVTYSLTPHNDGPATAMAGWSVTDILPAGLVLQSISGTGYACDTTDATAPVCTADAALAAGADGAVITVTATVTINEGTLKNVAYVSPAPGEVAETNPLVVPDLTTDTAASPTDNDAEAVLGVASPVSVGDFVWWDVNRNGLQDAGEPGVPGVTVTLQDDTGATVATTKTDADGYYAFSDLKPGAEYVIVFTAPDGTTFTTQTAGADASLDSDPASDGKVTFVAPSLGLNLTAPRKADLPSIDAGLVQLNLTLSKSVASKGPYYAEGNVTYTLVPHNDGPVDALAGWSVTEVLPEGSTLVGISGDGYTCYTNLVCESSTTLAAGADGNPITVVVQIPADFTGSFKNVAYVSPSPDEITETNPLVVPTIDTDTVASPTDNDAQAVVTVEPPESEGIVITLPNTGTTIPLTWLLAAVGIVAAGVILLGASRFSVKGRRH